MILERIFFWLVASRFSSTFWVVFLGDDLTIPDSHPHLGEQFEFENVGGIIFVHLEEQYIFQVALKHQLLSRESFFQI